MDEFLGPWERFVAAVAVWNLHVLPVILILVAIVRGRAESSRGALARASRRLGLIHLGLASWSFTRIVDELWAYRWMGILPSNPITGLAGSLLAMAVDVPVGLGLRDLRPWARRAGLILALFRLALAVLVLGWTWMNRAAVDLAEWPRLFLGHGLPPFSLVVLLWPGMAVVFRDRGQGDEPSRAAWVAALGALLVLIVVATVVATDGIDWVLRAAAELASDGAPA